MATANLIVGPSGSSCCSSTVSIPQTTLTPFGASNWHLFASKLGTLACCALTGCVLLIVPRLRRVKINKQHHSLLRIFATCTSVVSDVFSLLQLADILYH